MTLRLCVEPELRYLGAYLREDELVECLAGGVFRSGMGLLAVTSQRVLLLREGEDGQASVGIPLERLCRADWLAGEARGSVVVADIDTTAVIGDVPTADGERAVLHLRRRMHERAQTAGRPGFDPLAVRALAG
ncbi:hypothetical protein GCM10023321_51390 [Pseudonocardia eucalypti]|uniref:Uncharacterized protein n=1 Tax=Pseudonocardia eucalypti TaxID=648755 RepID=A0ABP9QL49_9PSEU|nr:hypothetical protein [Pseudonocardia eucalypti]